MIKGRKISDITLLKNIFYTTVRILTFDKNNDENGVGTGFFFNYNENEEFFNANRIPVLVTNKHMIEDAKKASIYFHTEPIIDGMPTGIYEYTIEDFESKFILHPDPDIDLCIIKMESIINEIKIKTGHVIYYQAFAFWQIPDDLDLKKMFPISDVYMIGYPDGLWDEINNLPISRKGVTASHPFFDFNGKPEGLVDIATFGGSSGSPLIYYYSDFSESNNIPTIKFELLGIIWGSPYQVEYGKLVIEKISKEKSQIPEMNIRMHLGHYGKASQTDPLVPI